MSCRNISEPVVSLSTRIKSIDYEGEPFPSFDRIKYQHRRITDWLNSHQVQPDTRQAIIQQYNEIFIYEVLDMKARQLVAPQINITFDKYNLPIIEYINCPSLMTQDEVYNYNENELYTLLGFRAKEAEVTEKSLINFLRNVNDFCSEYELNTEDILNNPSNIGYNPWLGLRVIDFGLMNDGDVY